MIILELNSVPNSSVEPRGDNPKPGREKLFRTVVGLDPASGKLSNIHESRPAKALLETAKALLIPMPHRPQNFSRFCAVRFH